MTDISLDDLVKRAKSHERQQRAEKRRRSWRPHALVLVETAVTCISCGHTDYCGSGVLVRYKRRRPDGTTDVHETDSPHSLEPFDDLPRQVRHRSATTRACRHCFMTGSISKMLPYVEKLRLQRDGNSDANRLDLTEADADPTLDDTGDTPISLDDLLSAEQEDENDDE